MTITQNFKLVVINPFNGLDRGDEINDAQQINEIVNSENEINVRRVFVEHVAPIAPIADQE